MNRYFPNVFRPIQIGNLEIKNRIEMSPAIPSLSTGDGYVTREMIEYHRSLARGGAGFIGCETGLFLSQQGKKVTVFDVLSLPEIASDGFSKISLMQLMDEHGVQLETELKLESIDKDGVTITDKQGRSYRTGVHIPQADGGGAGRSRSHGLFNRGLRYAP